METEICLQLKCSVSLPVVIDCQKDSGTTMENGTQVKPVLLTAIIFAVWLGGWLIVNDCKLGVGRWSKKWKKL